MPKKAPPPKKARKEALAEARRHMDKRLDKNDLWQVIQDHSARRPNAQTADRATALVLGAILEQGLEAAIFSHCVVGRGPEEESQEQRKLFGGGEEPPMNFAVKIRLAYGLGVYGPASRDDLDIMRTIRNLFAHDRAHLTFDDEVIAKLCRQIKWLDTADWEGWVHGRPESPRDIYIETTRHFFSFCNTSDKPVRYTFDRAGHLFA